MKETREEYQLRTGVVGITDRQWVDWLNDLKGAASGNPYATLCRGCHGRHGPHRDDACPHVKPRSPRP